VIRKATETSAGLETTEPIAYVLAVVGVLIVAGRGLVTSGSREPYTDHR
jgi:hypothetical protein